MIASSAESLFLDFGNIAILQYFLYNRDNE